MSVAGTVTIKIATNETLETNVPAAAAAKRVVTHDQYGRSQTFPSTSSPTMPTTKAAYGSTAMSSGAGTLDLTALSGTNGATVVGTGLKVQAFYFKNPTGNTGPITIEPGASNGYDIFGASGVVVLPVGADIAMCAPEGLADIASGVKNIDISGTGTEALEYGILMG